MQWEILQREVVFQGFFRLERYHLRHQLFGGGWSETMTREMFERDYLIAQINRFGGNISRTAEFVGMERSALHRKLKSLGV